MSARIKVTSARMDDRWEKLGCFKSVASTLLFGTDPTSQGATSGKYRNEECDRDLVVTMYSALGLIKEEDVLPALSGAAKLTSTYGAGDPYCAGNFRSTLPNSLCWRNAGRPRGRASMRPYVPMWYTSRLYLVLASSVSGSGVMHISEICALRSW